MNEKEVIEQLENLIEAWQLDEADLNQTDINAIKKILDKNQQLKEQLESSEKARKESMLILGEYRHYTLPTEEQNRENEDIVDKAYNNLILKQDIYIYIKENKVAKLIRNWEELRKVPPNDKYRIVVDLDMCCGHIIPITDEPTGNGDNFKCFCDNDMSTKEYFEHHVYLSTHTFYGSRYKYSTQVLQKHGFDIELENWDKGE